MCALRRGAGMGSILWGLEEPSGRKLALEGESQFMEFEREVFCLSVMCLAQ